jgi:hypothetical protein
VIYKYIIRLLQYINCFITTTTTYHPGNLTEMDQCGEASAATKLSALTLQDRTLLTAKVPKCFYKLIDNNIFRRKII